MNFQAKNKKERNAHFYLQIGRARETKLFFAKFERGCTKVQQSKDFAKVLENTIKIKYLIKNKICFPFLEKHIFVVYYSFKDVKNEFVFALIMQNL